jgi:hypothetical protein
MVNNAQVRGGGGGEGRRIAGAEDRDVAKRRGGKRSWRLAQCFLILLVFLGHPFPHKMFNVDYSS